MNPFRWKDRDSAAYHLLQLVYHGPDSVRHSAFEAIQAIRSPSILPELKQIALDAGWSYKDRSDAVYALAEMPGDVFIPEFAPILARYAESGFAPGEQAYDKVNDEVERERLWDERVFISAIFRLVGIRQSNRSWFLPLLAQAKPTVKVEFLEQAINSNCCYPGEPFFADLLTQCLDQYPELMTLEHLEIVASHGGAPETQWLLAHVEKIISLCVGADKDAVSAVLSYSSELTAKVAETHVDIAKLSSMFPYLEAYSEANKSESEQGESPTNYVPAFYSSALWQRLEQIYQRASGGDELAFEQLYELTNDRRLSIPVKAVATYFLGKLWRHDRALNKLCDLAQYGDETWGEYERYRPIRVEAANALQGTGTPQAWEALINVLFLNRGGLSTFDEKYVRWLSALTSQLDPSIPFEPVKEDQFNSHIQTRPWFDALTEATDDLDAVLKDL